MKKTLAEFSSLLNVRLDNSVYTSEDSVRYTFFATLLRTTGILPHEIVLEYPHPTISGAQIDTYIPSTSNQKVMVIEFKYHRKIPSQRNAPRTQKAGNLFNDVYRLTQFKINSQANLIFIYLTDEEMAGYLRNPSNHLTDFFELEPGCRLRIDESYLETKAATFRQRIGGSLQANITGLWHDTLPNDHHLRIYQITPIAQTGNE